MDNNLLIRKAEISELDDIMKLFDTAKAFMKATGNPRQWGDNYPNISHIRKDIENNDFYVCVAGEELECGFAMIYGDDPWYMEIEGDWLNNAPYAAVHRMASSGKVKGMAKYCLDWAVEEAGNIKVDTFIENEIMKALLTKVGFSYCGLIGIPDVGYGAAFQRVKE